MLILKARTRNMYIIIRWFPRSYSVARGFGATSELYIGASCTDRAINAPGADGGSCVRGEKEAPEVIEATG
jgi:hypothetical protein